LYSSVFLQLNQLISTVYYSQNVNNGCDSLNVNLALETPAIAFLAPRATLRVSGTGQRLGLAGSWVNRGNFPRVDHGRRNSFPSVSGDLLSAGASHNMRLEVLSASREVFDRSRKWYIQALGLQSTRKLTINEFYYRWDRALSEANTDEQRQHNTL